MCEKDIIKLILVWLLHDIATPAFGDATKKAFKDMHEEKDFLDYMKKHHSELCESIYTLFDISIEELAEYVKNNGLIGEILDMADKMYTARDAYNIAGNALYDDTRDSVYLHNIKHLIREDDLFADIILHIKIDEDRLICDDSQKLANLLEIRANMHNLIYLNENLRAREYYIWLVLQFLVEKGYYTKEELQYGRTTDWWIHNSDLEKFCRGDHKVIPFKPDSFDNFFDVTYYDDLETLKSSILEWESLAKCFIMKTPAFKWGTDRLVYGNDGITIQTLAEALPEQTARINELAQNTQGFYILVPKWEILERTYDCHKEFWDFLAKESEVNLALYIWEKN